jgi:serine/threonine protein kinase
MSDSNSIPDNPLPDADPRADDQVPRVPEEGGAVDLPGALPPVEYGLEAVTDGAHTVISSTPPCGVAHDLQGLAPADFGKVLEGRQLGHFRLEQFIGGGGMGAVFRGLDTELNRTVAVKVLYGGTSAEGDVERRFKNEAQSAARLDHDNIARVYFVGEDRGVHYIAFEYIDGVNVRDLVVRRGPLPLADVINYTLQIADALAHASRRDVVHRDIKPSNILITPEGRAKLVDMGLARLHQVESPEHDLTASGVTLGTFDYISPEQARDPRNADVRSDIYSLGCTVHYMLTGKPPFPQGTVLQKLLQHQGDEAPDPRGVRPELPAEVAAITHRMLAKAPADRFQDAEALIVELLNLARRLGFPTAAPGSTIWVATSRADESLLSRHLPWLAPTMLLIATVIALELFWYRSDSETDIPPRLEVSSRLPAATAAGSAVASQGTPEGPLPPARASADAPQPPPSGETSLKPPPSPLTSAAAPANAPPAPLGAERAARADDPTEPQHLGIVVVAPGRTTDANVVPTLMAAAAAAESGDVVELHFNGPRDVQPLKLANKRLTIRAGKGFTPRLVFRPEPDDVYPARHARSLITLLGGDLTLVGIHLEMDLPGGVASEGFAIVSSRGAESVRLERCWLTIRNAAHYPGVAFLHVDVPPRNDALVASTAAGEEKPIDVRLENCVVRGEATLLVTTDQQPVRLFWKNGLLVTPQRLIELRGDGATGSALDMSLLQVDLQHLTAYVGQGLLLANGLSGGASSGGTSSPVSLACTDSIVIGDADAALIECVGAGYADRFDDLLVWQGDRNFYEGLHVFLLIRRGLDVPPRQIDFAQWQELWTPPSRGHENLPRSGVVRWRTPVPPDRPTEVQAPADYALADLDVENPARGGATDGSDVGFLHDTWPTDRLPGD